MKFDTNDLLREIEPFLDSRIAFSINLKSGESVSWDKWEEMNCPKDEYLGLNVTGCDHSFAHTLEWMKTRNFDDTLIEALLGELRGRDGYCDCTVLIRLIKANREAR